jgi:hypothetical protein
MRWKTWVLHQWRASVNGYECAGLQCYNSARPNNRVWGQEVRGVDPKKDGTLRRMDSICMVSIIKNQS